MTTSRRQLAATANAEVSVKSACQALEHLEQSMLSAGFREGAAAYLRMAEVILAQRTLVADIDPKLLPLYEQLGEVARRLFGLLHPYDTVMRQLAVLAPADSEEGRARVIAKLERIGRRGASASQLARDCSLPAAEVEAALARLEQAGMVAVRNPGVTSPAYVLVEPPSAQRHDRATRAKKMPNQSRRRTPSKG